MEVKAAQKKKKQQQQQQKTAGGPNRRLLVFFFLLVFVFVFVCFFFFAAFTSRYEESESGHTITAKKIRLITVFIRISAQPRVSAHLASKHPS